MTVASQRQAGGCPLPDRAALHAALLAGESATTLLEQLSGGPIHARRLSPDETQGAWPDAAPDAAAEESGPVIRRHVVLVGGTKTLSTAMLWYAEHLLPPLLASRLATTGQPFGYVLRGLGISRVTLAARLCETGEPWALEHRAELLLPGRVRLALVEEHYSWGVFDDP